MSADRPCWIRLCSMACPVLAAVAAIDGRIQAAPVGAGGQNIVWLTFGENPLREPGGVYFTATLNVRLDGYPVDPSLASVSAFLGGMGGQEFPLEWLPLERIFQRTGKFADVDDLKASLNGVMVIQVSGPSSSTSTFSFNAQALTSQDIYSQARNLAPNASSVVQGDEPCTWDPPLMGPSTPFRLSCRRDDVIVDGLPAGTTSWDPGVCMAPGLHDMAVQYLALTPIGLYTPLTVVSGSIQWSNFEFMPPGSHATGPAVGTISSAVSGGIVSLGTDCARPGDINDDGVINGADLGILLGGWNQPGITDVNGDGTTDGADLGLLLGGWG